MSQVQCPNCGGYRINTSDSEQWVREPIMRPMTPAEKRPTAILWSVLLVPTLAIAFYVVVTLVLAFVWRTPTLGPGFFVLWAVLILAPTILVTRWVIRRLTSKPVADFAHKKVGRPGTDYFCELCYYRWHLAPGQPNPPVHFNPGLIAAGEIRLREQAQANAEQLRKQKEAEEAEAQARRKRDLEWNHWNQWNNPNN